MKKSFMKGESRTRKEEECFFSVREKKMGSVPKKRMAFLSKKT